MCVKLLVDSARLYYYIIFSSSKKRGMPPPACARCLCSSAATIVQDRRSHEWTSEARGSITPALLNQRGVPQGGVYQFVFDRWANWCGRQPTHTRQPVPEWRGKTHARVTPGAAAATAVHAPSGPQALPGPRPPAQPSAVLRGINTGKPRRSGSAASA